MVLLGAGRLAFVGIATAQAAEVIGLPTAVKRILPIDA
jgi:hypothetical protein